MNVLLIDTSSWISYFKNGDDAIDLALQEGRVYITPVIAAELLSGTANAGNRQKMIDLFNELPFCGESREHWYDTGNLRSMLFQKGYTVSTPDCHISQAVLDIQGYLKTEDKIFSKIQTIVGFRLAV